MAIIPTSRPQPSGGFISELERRFGKVRPSGDGWVRIECPTCDADHARKMKRSVNLTTGYSDCWICGQKMRFKELLGVTSTAPVAHTPREVHPDAYTLPFTAATPVNKLPPNHRAVAFLKKDHLTDLDKLFDTYGVVFVDYAGGKDITTSGGYTMRIAECLVFPVFHKDELVGWQARFLPGHWYSDKFEKMRYFHLFPKGEYLFGYDVARQYDFVCLVEGAKKAMKADYCVASLGKGLTQAQLQLLSSWKYVVVMQDGDELTQTKAQEYCAKLRAMYCNVINVNPADYGKPSPDEMTSEEVDSAVYEALKQLNYDS